MSQIRLCPKCLFSEVPLGWKKIRLRFALRINPSKSELLLQNTEPVSFIPMDAIGEYGGIRLNEEKQVGDIGSGYTYFRDGDILVAKITPCFENGKGALAKGLKNKTAFGTTEIYVLRADLEQLEPRFLFYLTISSLFRKLGEAEMHGAGGQKRVPERFIKDFYAGLPPLREQQIIVDYLDLKITQIDALIAKKQVLLDKLAEKRKALISHTVTKGLDTSAPMKDSGVIWMGKIPSHWIVSKLVYVAESMQTGPFGSQLHAEEYIEGGTPLINPADISDGRIYPNSRNTVDDDVVKRLTRHKLELGDIVIARRGEMGRAGLVRQENVGWLCGTGALQVRLKKNVINPEFLLYQFYMKGVSEYLSLQSVGSTMDNLNTTIIGGLPIIVPPLDEQVKLVSRLHVIFESINNQEMLVSKAIGRLKEYRSALIANAVIGTIDVRNIHIPTEDVLLAR